VTGQQISSEENLLDMGEICHNKNGIRLGVMCVLVIPVLGKSKKKGNEFEASQGYVMSSRLT
jgi:hypothetical protein